MQKHRVVFEVNVDGAEQWQGILNNVENLQKAFGQETTEIELVVHGKGLGLILNTNQAMRERLQLFSDTAVLFAACENTMHRMNLKKDDLMPFATTVDSGVAEVVRKQEVGWSYIKSGS
jgi:intracellular sulfur oxidation DsrE/DsrF family protein